ncbi:insulin-like growth factor-binding protein complex acid labile subunit isoform X2 [Drosophila kikkawai]|uniref:Insulin-like growth factor-binding protein complex acid labile subunit isoform X2 n=1 Tax=Drosophila kikkawai TaxID=30033 RepID=A0ABM3C8C6_DROKI|nr:insulin-like growth factor-binding protein complex acid labile subunit isoform X2 [Drosophila kikkawai]
MKSFIMILLTFSIDGSVGLKPLLIEPKAKVEQDVFSCPKSCVCQYAAFEKLPIVRWVKHYKAIGGNKDDYSKLTKLATCLLQPNGETQKLLDSLPSDLQALILLYTGGNQENKLSVNASDFGRLQQLTSLEFRGPGATMVIDEPMDFLQHANFEQIQLHASDTLQRPKFAKFPSEDYDYKPPSELLSYNNKYPLQFINSSAEIITYEQHIQRLKRTRMPCFYGWSRLEVLRIHNCDLNELHWQMFDGLTHLRHLSLEGNNIREIPPFAFSGAFQLKSISLAHNSLERLHYFGLAGLLQLETLNLSDNQLDQLSELSFPPLPKLLMADLQGNPLKHILPATFWVMNATRELYIGSDKEALNLRTWNFYGQFDSLHKLRTLKLGNVTTEALEHGVFMGLHNLECLTLRGTIKSLQFDVFTGLNMLRELDLSHCMIRELSMDALVGVKQLQLLNLSYNNLTNVPPGLLDDQLELKEVQLQGNQLTFLPLQFFNLPRVRVVRLDQNPWQCTCQMSSWVAHLTNVMRGSMKEICVKGNDNTLSCRNVTTYKIDKTLAPRCANYNGRSVYYVLRRQINCGAIKIIQPSYQSPGLPHWRKVQLQGINLRPMNRNQQNISHKKQANSLLFVTGQDKVLSKSQPSSLNIFNNI